ncbi:MAG: RsmD family RNA methyltransferase [Actinomycetota bacterium]
MRVIAGSAKGTRLSPVPRGTRPVSDRAREGVFSSLGAGVEEKSVLDLYAGTGAMGVEALSRGAVAATFVERESRAVRTIESNLDLTGLQDVSSVVRKPVLEYLGEKPSKAGIAFLDPPYDAGPFEVDEALSMLASGWLGPGWTVVLTRPTGGYMPVVPVDWRVARRLVYGDTLIVLYREV